MNHWQEVQGAAVHVLDARGFRPALRLDASPNDGANVLNARWEGAPLLLHVL